MGKNHGKHPGRRTPEARRTSIFAKIDNELEHQKEEWKKSKEKK